MIKLKTKPCSVTLIQSRCFILEQIIIQLMRCCTVVSVSHTSEMPPCYSIKGEEIVPLPQQNMPLLTYPHIIAQSFNFPSCQSAYASNVNIWTIGYCVSSSLAVSLCLVCVWHNPPLIVGWEKKSPEQTTFRGHFRECFLPVSLSEAACCRTGA